MDVVVVVEKVEPRLCLDNVVTSGAMNGVMNNDEQVGDHDGTNNEATEKNWIFRNDPAR